MSNTLKFKNGYAQQLPPTVGLGGERLMFNQLSEAELDELANKMPTLTYGQAKQAPPETFVPAHLAFDKKVKFMFIKLTKTMLSLFMKISVCKVGQLVTRYLISLN